MHEDGTVEVEAAEDLESVQSLAALQSERTASAQAPEDALVVEAERQRARSFTDVTCSNIVRRVFFMFSTPRALARWCVVSKELNVVVTALVVVTAAVGVGSLGIPVLSQAVGSSAVIRTIDRYTPPQVTAAMAQLRQLRSLRPAHLLPPLLSAHP